MNNKKEKHSVYRSAEADDRIKRDSHFLVGLRSNHIKRQRDREREMFVALSEGDELCKLLTRHVAFSYYPPL